MIERDCAPYLSYMRSITKESRNWLKRGLNVPQKEPYIKSRVTKNRKPVDTDSDVHIVLDYNLKELCGEKFRSDAIFCSIALGVVLGYGYPYFVFPVGDWKYCWSPEIKDAYAFFDNHAHDDYPEGRKQIEAELGYEYDEWSHDVVVHSDKWLKMIKEYLHSKKPYTTDNLELLIAKGGRHEVMVVCDEVYYVPYTTPSGQLFGREDADPTAAQVASDVMKILVDK